MVPLNLALEASNLGRILDLFLTLLLINLGLDLVVGVESKSTLVIGGIVAHSTCCQVHSSLHDAFPSLSS